MKCELFVREYLPAIRAILARKLTELGLTQQQAAERLYLTQPAVAFYKRQLRGKSVSKISANKELLMELEALAKRIFSKPMRKNALEAEYCAFCKMLFGNERVLEETV